MREVCGLWKSECSLDDILTSNPFHLMVAMLSIELLVFHWPTICHTLYYMRLWLYVQVSLNEQSSWLLSRLLTRCCWNRPKIACLPSHSNLRYQTAPSQPEVVILGKKKLRFACLYSVVFRTLYQQTFFYTYLEQVQIDSINRCWR